MDKFSGTPLKLKIGKNSVVVEPANICIRVDSETFSYEDELIRTVKGFFFAKKESSERRISIKPENIEKILTYLEHCKNY